MAFSKAIKAKAGAACNRCCCICHEFAGTKLEFHHIRQVADGGEDTFENCIPLCLNCHADMGGVNPKHPKGNSYSEEELIMHRDKWYENCSGTGTGAGNNCNRAAFKPAIHEKPSEIFTANRRHKRKVIRSSDPWLSQSNDW